MTVGKYDTMKINLWHGMKLWSISWNRQISMMNSMWVGVRRADAWTKSEASRMKNLHGRKGNQIVYKHELIRKKMQHAYAL